MHFEKKIEEVQDDLKKMGLDGWLLYDFRRSNDLACKFLEIPSERLLTRRFFYWIPVDGEPVKIVSGIEDMALDPLPGKKIRYHTWLELEKGISNLLDGSRRVAMEYSPRNALPYVSKVDAGTVEMIRGYGVEVVCSANLLQRFTNVWDRNKFETHRQAAQILDQTAGQVWNYIRNNLKNGTAVTEYAVQQFMLERFAENQCISQDLPICAVNEHSADPHYAPSRDSGTLIKWGDFILIDLWCKKMQPDAAYADITRVAVASAEPTERQQAVFACVRQAQQAATDLVRERFAKGIPVMGWEVDQASRDVIISAGYGAYFIHRTGHNIDTSDHGPGTHIDNYETHDDRFILPSTCFSIEPGIYLKGEFGVRLEFDVFVHPNGQVEVTGGIQDSIVCLESEQNELNDSLG